MSYREVFKKKHTFLVVVHVVSVEQALRNVGIAVTNGADGVFLINHNIQFKELLYTYHRVREQFPLLWIGLNFLDLSSGRALVELPRDANGLWIDDGGVHEETPKVGPSTYHYSWAKSFRRLLDRSGWKGLYFGGVAFKGQSYVTDPATVAGLCVPFMDVITTSGVSTGNAPDHGKIQEMKGVIGHHPLAIASGITPENVLGYTLYTDCFLIATGVSDSFTELNPSKVRKLADILANA